MYVRKIRLSRLHSQKCIRTGRQLMLLIVESKEKKCKANKNISKRSTVNHGFHLTVNFYA